MAPQSLPAEQGEVETKPPACIAGQTGGSSGPLTSFTEMHMAQMSTNILPKSCSHPILCVRAKGCGRAWEERGGMDGAGWGVRRAGVVPALEGPCRTLRLGQKPAESRSLYRARGGMAALCPCPCLPHPGWEPRSPQRGTY